MATASPITAPTGSPPGPPQQSPPQAGAGGSPPADKGGGAGPAATTPPQDGPPPPEKKKEKTLKKSKRWLRAQMGKQGLTKKRRRTKTVIVGTYGSHAYYNNLWAETMKDIRYMMVDEKKRNTTTNNDRKKMFQLIFDVYCQYLKIYKNLDETYDQMVHPQKRLVVRKLLDLVIARCNELKYQLCLCEHSEVCYFDEVALLEGCLPKEYDMPIPKYYFHDPTPEMLERDQWFENIKERDAKAKQKKEEEEKRKRQKQLEEAQERGGWGAMDDDEEKIDFENTIIPVQSMERARQAKGKYIVAKYYLEEEMGFAKKKKAALQAKRKMDIDKAAIIIQKVVRGFIARAKVKKMRNLEMEFLGMRPTSQNFSTDFSFDYFYRFNNSKCSQNKEILDRLKESRRELRKIMHKNYEDAKVLIHNKLRKIEGPDMAERFKYQIRSWYLHEKETKGKLPTIPKADVGGSQFMICPETLPEEVREKGRMATDPEYAEKVKKERKKKKEQLKKEKAKLKKQNKGKKKKGKSSVADNPTLAPAKFLDDFKAVNLEYNKFWRGLDDKDNPDQKHEIKYIIRDKRKEVSEEVRPQVDIAMRAELDYVKKILEKKKGKKKKGKGKKGKKGKGKKGKGKKGKGKKGKKGRKKKKKRGKDLTKGIPMETLFEELVHNRVIKQYPKERMEDLIHQCSVINQELRDYHADHPFEKKTEEWFMPGDVNPNPSFGDVIRAVKDICILPMGSVEVHEMTEPLTKSVLIAGPPGSGKRTLLNCICTELKATLMDLTAKNIQGKYPGKKGLKMLIHLLGKVGNAVQPTIILVDHCELMFKKKVPKDDKSEPKRLKKALGKFLKTVQGDDLILLVGITSEPWQCSLKPLKKLYQRMIYIPPAEYGTRFEMWKRMLSAEPEILDPNINFSLLAKLSAGWTVGHIRKTCVDVITRHHKDLAKQQKDRRKEMDPWGHLGNLVTRQMVIGKLSINMNNLIECITEFDPVFIEQEKAWTKWFNKTPMQKARMANQVRGDKKGKKGKGKDKKGQKGKGKGKGKGRR